MIAFEIFRRADDRYDVRIVEEGNREPLWHTTQGYERLAGAEHAIENLLVELTAAISAGETITVREVDDVGSARADTAGPPPGSVL